MSTRPTALLATVLLYCLAAPVAEVAAAPTKITTCGAIAAPGSYVLDNNLNAAGDCLLVSADFVTIDLNGFVIIGSAPSGIGIRGGPGARHDIVIHDGTIENFVGAIQF